MLGYLPLNTAGGTMTGALLTAPSTAGAAGLNVPPGVAPSSPNNGDMWTTTSGLFVRINGVTQIASVAILPSANGGTGINNGSSTITIAGNLATTAALTITAGSASQVAVWTGANALSGASALPFTVSVGTGGTGQTSFTAKLPILGNGASGLIQGTVSGSTTVFATTTGAITSGHCASWDGSSNVVDAGGPCTTGGGGGTVASSTIGQVAVYTGTTTVTGAGAMNFSTGILTLGVANTSLGALILEGMTTGQLTLAARATAGTPVVTFGTSTGTPAVTASVPLAINTTTGNITITGVAGMVLAGVTPAFTANPTLGVNAATAGSLIIANGGALGTSITVQNLSNTSPYNLNLAATAGTSSQLLTSGGGGAASNSWQNIVSLLSAGSAINITGTTTATIACVTGTNSVPGCLQPNGTSIAVAAGVISCGTMTSTQAGCAKPDNASILVTGGVISGPNFIFYPLCTAGGSVDCSTNINAAIGQCVSTVGGRIILPPGLIRASAVVFPNNSGGCDFSGAGTYQEYNGAFPSQTQPTNGTILYQTAADTLTCAILMAGNSGINHIHVHDLAFATVQPADGAITATGTGSGTILTVSSVLGGAIAIGQGVADTTTPSKVPVGTVIVSGSGTTWTTNQATTASGDTLTFWAPTVYKPSICGGSQAELDSLFFWNVYTGIQIGVSTTGPTNNTTAAGNATLHLAANHLVTNLVGAVVTDITHPTVIPANTTILAEPSLSSLTMSANATGAGVANGDTLQFSQASGRSNVHNVTGECFYACLDHRFSADFTLQGDIECAQFAQSQPTIDAFIQTSSNCVLFGRADQPNGFNIRAFSYRNSVAFQAVPDGAVSWGQFSGIQCDGCNNGIEVNQCTQASFSIVHINGSIVAGSTGINVGGNSCTQSPGVSPSTSAPYGGGTNILSFSAVDIQGPSSYCIAANVVDISVNNLHCQNFNGGGASVGIIMNAGATYTASGRQALNNSGTNGTTSGTIHGTVPF